VEADRVGPPAAGDLADREALLEAEFQEGDPAAGGGRPPPPRPAGGAGPPAERPGPPPPDVPRGRLDPPGGPAPGARGGGPRGRVGERERAAAALDAAGHVPHDADQERPEGRDAIGLRPREHAAGAEALDEDVLDGVVDLDDPGRPAPAGGQQGPDERLV